MFSTLAKIGGAAAKGGGAAVSSIARAAATGSKGTSVFAKGAVSAAPRVSNVAKLTKAPNIAKSNIYKTPTVAKAPPKPSGKAAPKKPTVASRVGQGYSAITTGSAVAGLGVSAYHLYQDAKDVGIPNPLDLPQDFSWFENALENFGSDINNIFKGAGQDFQYIEKGIGTAGSDISWGIGEIETMAPIAIGGVAVIALLLLVR